MMLCCQHSISHPRLFCKLRPFARIVVYRIKLIEKGLVVLDRQLLCIPNPFAPCRNRI